MIKGRVSIRKIVNSKNEIFVFVILVILGVAARILPHPANFAPVGAIALFGGFYFKKEWKIVIPMAIMFISDCLIGFYDLKIMLAVYFCLFINSMLGAYVRNNKLFRRAVPLTLLGSVIFFLITNYSVWAFAAWYPHTMQGLILCYTLALPFFFNSMVSDLFYVAIIFGAYKLAMNYSLVLNNIRRTNNIE